MGITYTSIIGAIFVGIGATLIMDIWAVFLRRVLTISSLDFCLVGRWFCYMPSGVFRHQKIAAAQKKSFECAVGWIAHYLIGIAFAMILVALTMGSWLHQPSLLQALLIGWITLAIPFFIMQPALGFGIAAANTPNPAQARFKSALTHSVFGVGLYASACLFKYFL